ncbi:PH and SEC7 domain-containing protein 3-like isoform X1, partial [Clarias magur]
MESHLILPASDDFTPEEPYLEAKLYIERVEQENHRCQEEIHRERTHELLETDGPEQLEHGVSITVYPVKVPSMHFSCATVQWDMPQTPADAPSKDLGSSEINSSYGLSMDWVINPPALDMPLLRQEEMIDPEPDEEPGQTGDDVEQEPAITIKVDSCQLHDPHTEVNVCATLSNEDEQTPFTEISQAPEENDDGGLLDCEENINEMESHLCIEDPEILPVPEENIDEIECHLCIEDPEILPVPEVLKESSSNFVLLPVPEQVLEDMRETKDGVELNSEAEFPPPCEEDCSSTQQSETNDPVLEQDSKQSEEPDLIQEADPPQQSVTPDSVCDAVKALKIKDSENVEPIIIANDKLENAERFQESVLEFKQEEPTCEEVIESTVEEELHRHKEQLIQQSECSDKLENSEESKQELEETSEETKEPSSNETETSDQSSQTKGTVSVEVDQTENPNETEPLDQPESSAEKDPAQLSELKDGEEDASLISTQPDELQKTEQENHTTSEQHENNDNDSVGQTEDVSSKHVPVAEEQPEESVEPKVPYKNGNIEVADREEARKLAERLYKLDNVQRTDVVRHLDKDNEFSRVVGEEYLKFFEFMGQSLDEALRSFLKEVVLIGETQERERVLDHFSKRYQQCNPETFSSSGAVLTLTCAVMLLNTDLHGQNVGKAMSMADFVSNLDGMNEGENFSKDLLKSFYNSIKNHQLEWAVEEKELLTSITLEQDSDPDAALRSKSNPFQDLAHDKKATVFQKGFLKRKAHADIDGKRTPWGKRSWKTFYAVLKGMVLYLQKDEYRKDWQSSEEVLSVHHALAERAEDYTKRPHVFRLQTADWRVFLFEAQSTEQMNSWIGRINLVSALYSSPPFPAAVGSQRKFCRPILPATQSALTLEKQLQSHAAMLQSFQEDLSALQQLAQESRRAKAREVEEHRQKEEYLQHE